LVYTCTAASRNRVQYRFHTRAPGRRNGYVTVGVLVSVGFVVCLVVPVLEDIAQAQETAIAWKDHDEDARDAGDTIRREVHERYGIDVDAPGGDAVAAALREAVQAWAHAHAERGRSGEELTASRLLFDSAARREREAQEQSEKDRDSGDIDGRDIADFNLFADRAAGWK
jgi:colicin import membrane protein